jgi:hypothetical protein
MQFSPVTTAQPRVYPPDPSGKCIYCGAPSPEEERSREHIIPFGLGGGLILLRASCAKCSLTTAAIETICLREMFLAYRTHFQLPSYRKKMRPTRLPITLNFGTHREKRYIPVGDHPNVLAKPRLPNAGITIGLPCGPPLRVIEYMLFGDQGDIVSKMRRLGIRAAVVEGYFRLDIFAQMLAKIAHAFAVAELGFNGFEHFLPDLILGRNQSLAGYLVGQVIGTLPMPADPPTGQVAWGLTKNGADWHVFVTIRLFAPHGAPAYSVIVGKFLPTEDLINRHGSAIRSAMLAEGARQLPAWLLDPPP